MNLVRTILKKGWRLHLLLPGLMVLGGTANAQIKPAAEPVRLADLLAEAERNHPSIPAAQRMVDAKRARVGQARALPDPVISAGYTGDPAPFKTQAGDPSSFRAFGVMQEFPYPGKRGLRATVAAKEADAESWNVEATRRRLLTEVRLAFFDLWEVDRQIEITQKNKALLEQIARVSEVRYASGKGIQQDLLRAQMEVSRIALRLEVLGQRRNSLAARLNSLLARSMETPLGALEPVEKAAMPASLEALLSAATSQWPEIRREEESIAQGQVATQLARREFYPDFGVAWEYMNRTSGMPEMYALRFSMNLPIFNRTRRNEAVSEAAALEAAARHRRDALRTEVGFQVKDQFLQARTAEQLLALYEKTLVPQTRLALESAQTAYQTGAADFLSLISNFVLLLEYETAYYEELAKFQKALAKIQEFTGLELVK